MGMGTMGLSGQMLLKEKFIPFSGGGLQREDNAHRPRVPQKVGYLLLLLAAKFLTRTQEGTGSTQSILVKKHPILFMGISYSCQ